MPKVDGARKGERLLQIDGKRSDPRDGPVVMGLLQNMWFKDHVRARETLKRYQEHEGGEHEGRQRFIRDMLFFGCLTGRRLRAAFGEKLCGYGGIVWEEASPELGGRSDSVFPADPKHIRAAIDRIKPGLIIAFGKVAWDGLLLAGWDYKVSQVVRAPHPTSRRVGIQNQLNEVAAQVLRWWIVKSGGTPSA